MLTLIVFGILKYINEDTEDEFWFFVWLMLFELVIELLLVILIMETGPNG
ncbi:hypothetical protein PJM40_0022 [Salmonella phage vB_SenP_UTK0002]|nr:hypothetical protein PJM40_0022 [Salmonella phage vB_SenP_UTK0002]